MKPTVLALASFYLPGFRAGGPIRTIANMVQHLSDEFEFRILCSDRDLGDTYKYPGIDHKQWQSVGNALVCYVPPGPQSLIRVFRVLRRADYDILYLNSFFAPKYTIFPIVLRALRLVPRKPTVVAPRGEFSAGALSIKRAKKRLFILVARGLGLFDDVFWHASTNSEARDIRSTMSPTDKPVVVATNISIAPDLVEYGREPELRDGDSHPKLEICFLGRISRMKNLDFAIRVLSTVRCPVSFSIYGPIEDDRYWAECCALLQELPPHVSATYMGSVAPGDVRSRISEHQLLFLPTRGENFGHVLVEALGCGVPLLISDQTPWRDLQRRGVGWDIPLDSPEAFRNAVESMASLSPEQFHQMRTACMQMARNIALDPKAVYLNKQLFKQALTNQFTHRSDNV